MITKIQQNFLCDERYLGAVLFGSQLHTPCLDSDTDIVLFTPESTYTHQIHKLEGRLYDVFEMSLEQAFEFLRIRHPLWMSAFSTGVNVTNEATVDLILDTASKIISQARQDVNKEHLNKLIFAFELCHEKLCKNNKDIFIYFHCTSEYIKAIKRILFYTNNIKPCAYNKQMEILTSEFGYISKLIRDLIIENNLLKKHKIAKNIYKNLRKSYPEVEYPINLK